MNIKEVAVPDMHVRHVSVMLSETEIALMRGRIADRVVELVSQKLAEDLLADCSEEIMAAVNKDRIVEMIQERVAQLQDKQQEMPPVLREKLQVLAERVHREREARYEREFRTPLKWEKPAEKTGNYPLRPEQWQPQGWK